MSEKVCACCSAREAAMTHYEEHVADGEVGLFIDGIMDAVAQVAACNVMAGREADERELLIDQIGKRFDRAVLAHAAADAKEAVHQ